MSRCKHKQLVILETITGCSEHVRDQDGTWSHNNEPGVYNRRLDVSCLDCDMRRTFWRGQKNLPKYMKKAMEELRWI